MKRRAFTLIEMLIVMGVMAILLALSVPRYLAHIENAEMIDMKADMRNVQREVATYTGEIPLGALTDVITAKNARDKDTSGPFYKIGPIDYIPQQDIFVMSAEGEVFYTMDGVEVVDYTEVSDFEWKSVSSLENGGYWRYVGTDSEVIIPHKLEKEGKLTTVTSYYSMFCETGVTKVTSTNKDIIDMCSMFYNSTAKTLDLSRLDTSSVKDMTSMFEFSKATTIDLSGLDTSNVTTMNSMFRYSAASKLDISNFKTSGVTDMFQMFFGAKATEIDVSELNTNEVTDMYGMFYGCKASELNLKNFNTSKVTNMENMFAFSAALKLDLSSFETPQVTRMRQMFTRAAATEIDVSQFDTSNVTDMNLMFNDTKVETLDLSSFVTSQVTDMNYMFQGTQAKIVQAKNTTERNKFRNSTGIPSGLVVNVK